MFHDVIFDHDQNWIHVHVHMLFMNNNASCSFCLHELCVHDSFHESCIEKQLLILFFYLFNQDRSQRMIFMKFFYQNWCVFFIVVYDFHVLCSYSSHLIRSSNHMNFMFHFMSLIKLTKYELCSFSIIMNYDNSTCLLIKSSFKNHNKLMWNIEWIFIFNDN